MNTFERQHYGKPRAYENLITEAHGFGFDVYDGLPDDPGWEVLDLVHMDDLDTSTDTGKKRYRGYTEATDGVFGVALPPEDDDVPEGHVIVVGRTGRYTDYISEEEAGEVVDELMEDIESNDDQEADETTDPFVDIPGIDKKYIIRQVKVKNAQGVETVFTVIQGGKEDA